MAASAPLAWWRGGESKKTTLMTTSKKVEATQPKKEATKELTVEKLEQNKAGKLSLVPNALNTKQVLFVLQKTPKAHIYQRPGKGGGMWDFVTGTYVKKVLNYTFGWMWDFEIKDKGREGDQVWVQGRLTIKNPDGKIMIIKEQFGRADCKFKRGTKDLLDYGNDLKAASTDALKKCASELGIASDIYGKNEFQEVAQQQTPPVKHPVAPQPVKTGVNYVDQVKKFLVKKGAKNEPEALAIILKATGQKVVSFKSLTEARAKVILAYLLNK